MGEGRIVFNISASISTGKRSPGRPRYKEKNIRKILNVSLCEELDRLGSGEITGQPFSMRNCNFGVHMSWSSLIGY